MRVSGVHRVIVHCADYKYGHSVVLDSDSVNTHMDLVPRTRPREFSAHVRTSSMSVIAS
jgi:hypothetical protein